MENRLLRILGTKGKNLPAILLFALIVGSLGGLTSCKAHIGENKLLTSLGYTKTFLRDIVDKRATFSRDDERISQIAGSLPLMSYRDYDSFSGQTEPQNEISIVYNFGDNYTRGGNGIDPFPGVIGENNALILFAAFKDLDRVNFLHYDGEELNNRDSFTVEDLGFRFGDVKPFEMSFSDLYKALGANIEISEYYFAHYSRIYLGARPESVSYRNDMPDEVKEMPDGSTIWIYKDFGKTYSLSLDGAQSANPENTAIYYFDSSGGLRATRFISGENCGKTYREVTGVLGLPSVKKRMGLRDRYIAYPLSESGRDAYFVLRAGRVIEEGVMLGTDYKKLEF